MCDGQEWWARADMEPDYRDGRTFDQGALGSLLFSHRQRSQGLQADIQWNQHLRVMRDATVMNNHPPLGSFARAHARGSSGGGSIDQWWCQHFVHPVLQLAGQGDEVRKKVLRRVWRGCMSCHPEGAGDICAK